MRAAQLGAPTAGFARAHERATQRHLADRAAERRARDILNATTKIRNATAARARAEADDHERAGRPATAQRIRSEVALGYESRVEKETWGLEQLASGDRTELRRLRRAADLN